MTKQTFAQCVPFLVHKNTLPESRGIKYARMESRMEYPAQLRQPQTLNTQQSWQETGSLTFALTFSKDAGLTSEKHIKNTSWAGGRGKAV